jgi:hypothetical protein
MAPYTAGMGAQHRGRPDPGARVFKVPVADAPPPAAHVLVNIEYRIDPARADEFRALMQESRRSRLRHGALSWELLRDLYDPGRFVEQIVDPNPGRAPAPL